METATRLDDVAVVRALRERDETAFTLSAETLTPDAEGSLREAFRKGTPS